MSENGAAVVRRQSADESEKSVDTRLFDFGVYANGQKT